VSFRVDPGALRTAADEYAAHADQLDVSVRYHENYSQFDWSNAGLIQLLNGAHHDLTEVLRTRLRQAADLLRDSAIALRRAADGYERTDHTAAARLDALLPSPWPVDSQSSAAP